MQPNLNGKGYLDYKPIRQNYRHQSVNAATIVGSSFIMAFYQWDIYILPSQSMWNYSTTLSLTSGNFYMASSPIMLVTFLALEFNLSTREKSC